MIKLICLGLVALVMVGTYYQPVYGIAYMLTATIFFLGIELFNDEPTDMDAVCLIISIWVLAPLLVWSVI